MNIVNWKTTIGAVIPALAIVLNAFGVVSITVEVQNALIVVGVAIIGIFAKDNNVTGGSTPNG